VPVTVTVLNPVLAVEVALNFNFRVFPWPWIDAWTPFGSFDRLRVTPSPEGVILITAWALEL
jgi:hypothetical protein